MQEFRTESKKILDLVVNSIYSTKDVFLRELISNASDALDKVALEISAGRLEADQVGELAIELDFDVAERTITVSDNGIGMDAEALERDLGTIAHSSRLGSQTFRRASRRRRRNHRAVRRRLLFRVHGGR